MTLQDQDQQFIWHPYTHQRNMLHPIPILRGKGSLIIDNNDTSYIDAISSWWVNIHGHSHPYIADKIYQQALTLEHVIFAGFTHKPAVELASRLISKLPGLAKIFYSDNGSTATEVAIKMALQYFKNLGINKTKIIAFDGAYHGDTFGSMSISERSIFNKAFDDKLFDVIFIEKPTAENLQVIKEMLSPFDDIACFIYEPLLQGAGGMLMYQVDPMNELLDIITKKGIICIADEVLTGFYRTGTFLASDQINIRPDIICLSKGLTGGTMPLGVTACTQTVYDAFVSDDKEKTFYHGHSFTANPLACSAALASLDLLEREECKNNVEFICRRQQQFLDELSLTERRKKTFHRRRCGTIAAFEIQTEQKDDYLNELSSVFTKYCLLKGVYLRPLGNTIYIMPPYCITKEELEKVYLVIFEFLDL